MRCGRVIHLVMVRRDNGRIVRSVYDLLGNFSPLTQSVGFSGAPDARHRERTLEGKRHCDEAEQQKSGETAHGEKRWHLYEIRSADCTPSHSSKVKRMVNACLSQDLTDWCNQDKFARLSASAVICRVGSRRSKVSRGRRFDFPCPE
jgi:hypothetical protein